MGTRTRMAAAAVVVVVAVLAVSCGGPTGPTPASIALRKSDVPAGWARCGWSGPITSYLLAARKDDGSSAASVQRSWAALKKVGATSADVTSYVADRADCSRGVGHTVGASALTWTIAYTTRANAHRGYEVGVLGFPTPAPGRIQTGLEVGPSTGLGADSWTLIQTTPAPPLWVAWWREQSFTTFLVVLGLPQTDANPIALRVDTRMDG